MAKPKSKAKWDRDRELGGLESLSEEFDKLFGKVEKAFQDQIERTDTILDCWDLYNCELGPRQFYSGNSQQFIPFIRDAIRARRTRFTNQIFPRSERHIEAASLDGHIPYATMAVAESHIRTTKLRTEIIPALLTAGDIEGQWSIYVDWKTTKLNIVKRVNRPVEIDGVEMEEAGKVEEPVEETVEISGPSVEIILDADLAISPAGSDSIEDAIESGGFVAIRRRWTKEDLRKGADDGKFRESVVEELDDIFGEAGDGDREKDPAKEIASAKGVKLGNGKSIVGYEVWKKLKVNGERRRCRIYFVGKELVLGCKVNPYWCDKIPVISAAVEKDPGSFKGKSPLTNGVDEIQIGANDTLNEMSDAGHFAMMPITVADPERVPNVTSLIMACGAIWKGDPNSIKFMEFPDKFQAGAERLVAAKNQIFQSLGVNPSMIPQSNRGRNQKANQAEIANEQAVDALTTADVVTSLEAGILTEMVNRFIAYDHQFRDKALMTRAYGELGILATMQEVDPIEFDSGVSFSWFGVEAARNAAQMQQQIAGINVLTKIPPQLTQGYRLDLGPAVAQIVENMFGPRIARLTFKNALDELTVDPQQENEMLAQGFDIQVHPQDQDQEHLQAHMAEMQAAGDPHGTFRNHINKHMQSMAMKSQAAMMQQQGQQPGGGGPKGGAQPQAPKPKGVPGAMHPDQMPAAGAITMPRKM